MAEDGGEMDLLIAILGVALFVTVPFVCIAAIFLSILALDRLGHLCGDLRSRVGGHTTRQHPRIPA